MKFIYADSLDHVDPNYDFIEDRMGPGRESYWDDQFPHEYLGEAPYDGLLISRGIVGDHKFSGKYTQSQSMRLRRDGARKFLRIDKPEFEHLMVFGDCGAFNYADYEKPPYTPTEILEFYEDAGFSHGCSVDHVIFEFDRELKGMDAPSDRLVAERVRTRFDITLENAEAFYKECGQIGQAFVPLGVVQGWSPGSMAEAGRRLVGMGYDYLAIGGMVPLGVNSIKAVLAAIREIIPAFVKLHLLGFGKIDNFDEFLEFRIESFDTTSPLIRAFKDKFHNFFMPGSERKLRYYTAIRIPQATENRNCLALAKKGRFTQEFLIQQERTALNSLRGLDKGRVAVDAAIDAVMAYTASTLVNPSTGESPSEKTLSNLEVTYRRMLEDRPWQHCSCGVCKKVSVEAAIFRASNRNKRRGIHNMWVFNNQLKKLIGGEVQDAKGSSFQSDSSAAER